MELNFWVIKIKKNNKQSNICKFHHKLVSMSEWRGVTGGSNWIYLNKRLVVPCDSDQSLSRYVSREVNGINSKFSFSSLVFPKVIRKQDVLSQCRRDNGK